VREYVCVTEGRYREREREESNGKDPSRGKGGKVQRNNSEHKR
jgi:hypothetical protein